MGLHIRQVGELWQLQCSEMWFFKEDDADFPLFKSLMESHRQGFALLPEQHGFTPVRFRATFEYADPALLQTELHMLIDLKVRHGNKKVIDG